tara:strand:- start:236 stop:376 length:141 start_codon:yes stop_codon:yes gene_type:complete
MTDKKNNPFMSSMIVFSSKDIREKSEAELKLDALAQETKGGVSNGK